MIIQCESCSRKFVVKDEDMPPKGRTVQCGYCSVTWHQMPILVASSIAENKENLSVESIKASDGKMYKFLGSQWAQLLPSGKTGLFAKKKIGQELDRLTGRKETKTIKKKSKKLKEVDPSLDSISTKKQLPDIYKPNEGLGFLGYIFLIILSVFSIIGVIKTFESDLINYFPELEYLIELLDEQLIYVAETVKNIITLVKDLINSY